MTRTEEDIRIRDGVRPDLRYIDRSWLGVPIDTDDPAAIRRIDLIRRALGGRPHLPKQHLGEAQIIEHLETTGMGLFATDDRDATEMACRRGLEVVDTCDIVIACYDADLLGCPEAHKLLEQMAAEGRGVVLPDNHWQVCPPRT
jgi:hypothetical protein